MLLLSHTHITPTHNQQSISMHEITILMLIYHMRPEQPMREEEGDDDKGDLPFPIREVGPN